MDNPPVIKQSHASAAFGGVPTVIFSDGTQAPWIALGNGGGGARTSPYETGTLAIQLGIRSFDTAQGYHTEEDTGRFIKDASISRGDVYVTTKLSNKDGDPSLDPIKIEELRTSIRSSIKGLSTMPDMLLLHSPFVAEKGKLAAFWQVLEDLKDRGELTSSLGVCNFRPQDLTEILNIAKHKPVVHQMEFHPLLLSHVQPILDMCASHDIVIWGYAPLFRHPSQGGPLKPIFERIAARLSAESGEAIDANGALLQWLRAKNAMAVASSTNARRIKGLVALSKLPVTLSKAEVEEVDAVGRKLYWRSYVSHLVTLG